MSFQLLPNTGRYLSVSIFKCIEAIPKSTLVFENFSVILIQKSIVSVNRCLTVVNLVKDQLLFCRYFTKSLFGDNNLLVVGVSRNKFKYKLLLTFKDVPYLTPKYPLSRNPGHNSETNTTFLLLLDLIFYDLILLRKREIPRRII